MIGQLFGDRRADRVDPGIPLRISAVGDHPHFDRDAVATYSDKVDVLLDGEALPEVAGWDVPGEEVWRKRRDAEGAVIIARGQPTYETLNGRVEVRRRPQPEQHRHA